MRRLALVLAAVAGQAGAEVVSPAEGEIVWAKLAGPTDRYPHGVLGDALEWDRLILTVNTCIGCAGLVLEEIMLTLPPRRVFEDIEARLADIDGDERYEVVVVESDLALGASLAVYGPRGKIAATSFIGAANRWLAPAGIADLDGDGLTDIAYVDRPHILGDLVLVRLDGDQLVETMRRPGFSNHRIGDDFISGGLRDCGSGPELVIASVGWTRVLAFRGGISWDLGPMPSDGLMIPPC